MQLTIKIPFIEKKNSQENSCDRFPPVSGAISLFWEDKTLLTGRSNAV